jgi:hypothetical protein
MPFSYLSLSHEVRRGRDARILYGNGKNPALRAPLFIKGEFFCRTKCDAGFARSLYGNGKIPVGSHPTPLFTKGELRQSLRKFGDDVVGVL